MSQQINDESDLGCTSTKEDTEPKSTLATAISIWKSGKHIDSALFAELVEQGYDVPSLERFYRVRAAYLSQLAGLPSFRGVVRPVVPNTPNNLKN